MGIYITDKERIRRLQRENSVLRALVGEPSPLEPNEGAQQEPATTLFEKTNILEENLSLLAEVIAL